MRSYRSKWLGRLRQANRGRVTSHTGLRFRFEALEDRNLLAITAVFSASSGVLNVLGDSQDNTIEVSRTAGGNIQVNAGAVVVTGGTPAVDNTTLIQVFGLSGNDTISINEANGALPAAKLYGGPGNDTLTGGSGNDQLFGQSGNDQLLGRGGADFAFGGSGGDTLTGGDGDDLVFGQSGNDAMIWNPGDDTDLNEGGADSDTTTVNGGNGDEQFTTTANGTRVRFDRLNPAPFSIDIGTTENLVLNAGGGNDTFSATGNLASLIAITVDGGAGNDTLLGSNGADVLIGGDNGDTIDGNQGNDVILMGAGNDTFNWDPGDGSDVVEGQADFDTAVINGSNGSEIFEISANGARTRLTRNLGNIVFDFDDIQRIDVHLSGSTDTLTVNDLTGTDVLEVNANLAAIGGGIDGAADNIIIFATNLADVVLVSGTSSSTSVLGLAATVNILSAENAFDRLTINLLGGDDALDASGLASTAIALTGDGGDGDDVLTGGDGNDVLLGGLDDDVLIGGPGVDILDGGLGDNVVIQ